MSFQEPPNFALQPCRVLRPNVSVDATQSWRTAGPRCSVHFFQRREMPLKPLQKLGRELRQTRRPSFQRLQSVSRTAFLRDVSCPQVVTMENQVLAIAFQIIGATDWAENVSALFRTRAAKWTVFLHKQSQFPRRWLTRGCSAFAEEPSNRGTVPAVSGKGDFCVSRATATTASSLRRNRYAPQIGHQGCGL